MTKGFVFSGIPFIANAQTSIFYTFNYTPLLLNILFGIDINLYSTQINLIVNYVIGIFGYYICFVSTGICQDKSTHLLTGKLFGSTVNFISHPRPAVQAGVKTNYIDFSEARYMGFYKKESMEYEQFF